MKWPFLIMVCVIPAIVQAATVYVDPDCSNNGDGTTTECAGSVGATGAKNTFVGLSMSAGNTYAGKGGSGQTLTSYQIPASGSEGSPITITSYGTGKFRFTGNGTYAVATISRSYVTLTDLEFASETNCLYLTGVASHVTVTLNTFIGCGTPVSGTQAGVALEGASATADMDDFTIEENDFTDVVGWCVRVNDIPATNSTTWERLSILNNNCTNAGSGGNTGAIKIAITGGSSATFIAPKINGNIIDRVGDEESSPTHAIQLIRSPAGDTPDCRFFGAEIDDNVVTNGGGGISVNNVCDWGTVRTSIQRNYIRDITASAAIISFQSSNGVIDYNDIANVSTYSAISYIDGIGIDLDLGNTNFRVCHNVVTGNRGDASQTSSGQGITLFGSSLNLICANKLYANRHGLMFGDDNSGASPGIPNYIVNNTICDNVLDGIHTVFTVEQVNYLANNIVCNNGRYGINSIGTGTQNLVRNIFNGNAGGNYNSQTAGATDITAAPALQADYKPSPGSISSRAGISTGFCLDYRGRVCPPDAPNIGAYQSTSGDPAAPRAVRN